MEAFSRKKSPMGLEQTINFQRKLTHPSPPIPRMHKRAKLTESDINFPAPEIENPFVRPLNPQTEIKEEEKSPPKAQGSWKMSFHLLKAHLSPKYIPLFNPINIENVVNRHIPKYSLFDGANGVKEEGGSSQGGIYNQYSSNSIMGSFCVSGSNSSLPTQYSISAFPSRMAPKKVSVNSNNPEENSKKPRIQTNTHSFMPQKVNALHFEPRVVQLNGEVQIPSYPNCNYRVALPNNMLKEEESGAGVSPQIKKEGKGEYHWTEEEHLRMQEGMQKHEESKGKHCYWNNVAEHVLTKTAVQCKSHNQNFPHSTLNTALRSNKKRPKSITQLDNTVINTGPWTNQEHHLLTTAMLVHREYHGKHKFWKRVAEDVSTRTSEQCKSHNQKRPALNIENMGSSLLYTPGTRIHLIQDATKGKFHIQQ